MARRIASLLLSFGRDRSGAALVEFALVAPLLVLIALGMFGFGRGLYQYQQVVNGVRDAARFLAHTADPTNGTAQSQAQTLATKGCLSSCSSVPLRVANWNPSDVNFQVTNITNGNTCSGKACYNGASTLHEVIVTTNVSFADLNMLRAIGFPSIQFHVRHEERNIPD
jgi:Flp pilus assembly protein TadG